MNKLTVKIKINEEETNYEFTSNYNPCDTSSISNCIDSLISQTEGFKEDLRIFNIQSEKFGFGPKRVSGAQFIFTREDGSIINDITINDVNEIKSNLNFANNFFII